MQTISEIDYRSTWYSQAETEARKNRSTRYHRGRGVCVLFILDFSESMRGEGVRRLKRGVSDILNEFSNHPELDENVAVIIFGKETKFLHYYSNRYDEVKQIIENLEPCGPSPLTAAFILSLGGLFNGSSHIQKVGDFLLPPRVILFTDGNLTDFLNEGANEDEAEYQLNHSIVRSLFSVIRDIARDHPIFCFPVGENPNYELLNEISKESFGGRVLDINKARWLGKHTLHYRGADIAYRIANQTIVEREVLRSVVVSLMSWETYEEDDLDTIIELLSQRSNIIAIQERITDDPADKYHKEKYVAVPKLGTRVRRGPHWTFENQDSEGVGTVVGHGESAGLVFVEWDTGIRFPYIHGREGMYEVVVSDEPRIPEDWFAAVGCFVKRGPDWKWEDQDGGVGSIGTVYRVKDDATVYVRWPCGRSSNYRCGYDGKFDIEICDPFSPQVIQAVKEQQMKAQISDSDEKRCNDLKGKINKEDTTRSVYEPKEVNGSTSDSKVTQDSRRLEKFKPHSTDTTYLSKPIIQKRHMSSGGRHHCNDMVQEDDSTAVTDDIDIQTDSVSEQPPVCKEMRNPDLRTADTKTDCQIEHENIDGFIDCTETFDVLKEFHNDLSVKNNFSSVDKQDFFSNNNKTSYHRGAIEEKSSKNNLQNIQHSENRLDNLHRCWQWLDSTGVWIEYPADVNSQINNSLRKRPNASVVIQFQEQSFRVVASKSIQINIESKERTEIRCINSK